MAREHHHVVSQGYQRLFGTAAGIALIDKQAGTIKTPVGTKHAFARRKFNSFKQGGEWTDPLEDEWRERESESVPCARRINEGSRSPEDRFGVKVLAAVHFARSYGFESVHERIVAEVGTEQPALMGQEQRIIERFTNERGRPPGPGEIENLARVALDELITSREQFVRGLVSSFNFAAEYFSSLHVQIVEPRRQYVDFVFADCPFLLWHTGGRHGSVEIALRDANRNFFPIGPRVGVCLTASPYPDAKLSDDQVQALNRRSWRIAHRFLGCHPDTNAKRALLEWNLETIKVS